MSDVFISYSRKDIAFAKLIREALQSSDLDTWIDWERIPVGENWWREICEAIAGANVFMFIISKSSTHSPVCRDEINEALKNKKRIIPIVVDNLSPEVVREFAPDLPQINWIAFEQEHIFQITENPAAASDKPEDQLVALPKLPQFQQALQKLSQAIHTDWDWVKFHTSLQLRALEWEKQQNPSYLLSGAALQSAEQLVLNASGKDPSLSALQVQYLTISRQEETKKQEEALRQREEKLRLEQKARARQRLAMAAIGVGLVAAVVLGVFGWTQRDQYLNESIMRATAQAAAEEQRNTAQSRQLAAQSINRAADRFDTSILLAVQSNLIQDSLESRASLASALQTHVDLRQYLHSGVQQVLMHLAISPDNRWVAAGGNLRTVTVWDKLKGQSVSEPLTGFSGWVSDLAFSNDSRTLIGKDTEGAVLFWETVTWKVTHQYQDKGLIQFIPLKGEESLYMTRESGGSVSIRNLIKNQVIQRFGVCSPADGVTQLALSPQGDTFAVACGKVSVRVWDLKTGTPLTQSVALTLGMMGEMAFSPAGNLLVFSGQQGFIDYYAGVAWVWDLVKDPQQPATLQYPVKHGDNCGEMHVEFAPDGKSFATGCGKTIRLWSSSTKASLGKPLTGLTANVTDMVFTQNGAELISGENERLLVWNVNVRLPLFKKEMVIQDSSSLLTSFTIGTDQYLVDAGCGKVAEKGNDCVGGVIGLTNISQPTAERQRLTGEFGEVKRIAASADGHWVASSHADGQVNLWNGSSRQLQVAGLEPASFKTSGLAISRDGHWLASSGVDGVLNLWDLSKNPPVNTEIRPAERSGNQSHIVYGVLFSPDGKSLLEVGSFLQGKERVSKVQAWDLATKKLRIEIPYKDTFFLNGAATFAVSPDSQTLALALYTDIRLFNLQDGKPLPSPTKSVTSQILSIAFSPDGRWLATGGSDKTVTMWDVRSMQVVTQFGSTDYAVQALAFSPNGLTLVNLGDLRKINLWDLSAEQWRRYACSIANRNLSEAEWQNYLAGIAYQKTCPDEP